MDAIVFDHVSKVYPDAAAPAVDDVSLEVPQGQTVVILGTSGSGKTTLLKMVNRLYEPSGGQIFVEGTEIHALPAVQLRRRIGYVIQQIGLFPHWTVADNVATVPRILGWPAARVKQRVDELLELVGLPPGEYRGRYPQPALGRPAAACGHRACAGRRPGDHADGRALRRGGRHHPRPPAGGVPGAAAAAPTRRCCSSPTTWKKRCTWPTG